MGVECLLQSHGPVVLYIPQRLWGRHQCPQAPRLSFAQGADHQTEFLGVKGTLNFWEDFRFHMNIAGRGTPVVTCLISYCDH